MQELIIGLDPGESWHFMISCPEHVSHPHRVPGTHWAPPLRLAPSMCRTCSDLALETLSPPWSLGTRMLTSTYMAGSSGKPVASGPFSVCRRCPGPG